VDMSTGWNWRNIK